MCKARAEEAGTGAHIDDDRVRLELCPDELNHLMREAIKLMREAIKLSGDPRLKQGTLTRAAAKRARDLDLEPDLTFVTFRFSRRASASSAASSVWPPGRILSAFLPEMRISLSSSNEIISCTTCSIHEESSSEESSSEVGSRPSKAIEGTQHALGMHSARTRQTLGSHSADTRKSLGRHL